jgi:hypothetical protein
MATAKKTVDPLVEELAPLPAPTSAGDVQFGVKISPYIVNGIVMYQWEIVDQTHADHVDSYVGHSASGWATSVEAELAAEQYIQRIRETLSIKLSLREPYIITL